MLISFTVLGEFPPPSALQGVQVIDQLTQTVGYNPSTCHQEESIAIGANFPPTPPKLIERIKAWEFIDISELLLDILGCSKSTLNDDAIKSPKLQCQTVTNILQWIQYIPVCLSVISKTHPSRVSPLLAYQTLIIEANIEYNGDN